MLYKISMYPLYEALPVPYVSLRVTRGALVAHLYTYAPPRCRTSQHRITFIPLTVYMRNELGNSVFDKCETGGFYEEDQCFFMVMVSRSHLSSTVLGFSYFFLSVGIVGLGSSDCYRGV